MTTRKSQATWENGLKNGTGRISFANGQFDQPFSFSSRFEEGEGTNPEELIAAAHAGCFSMALANELEKEGHAPKKVQTEAEVELDTANGEPAITVIVLTTKVEVAGIADDRFQEIAANAKENCPVSRALAGAEIRLNAEMT